MLHTRKVWLKYQEINLFMKREGNEKGLRNICFFA